MFRFTIRDVLWLTVVVAMGVAWLVDRGNLRREKSVAVNRMAQRMADATNRPVGVSDKLGEYTVRPFGD